MKKTSNHTNDAEKLAEMMRELTAEDRKIVMIYAGALRDRAALGNKKEADNLEASEIIERRQKAMKKEYERGNIREVINNIPDMNLAKKEDIEKDALRMQSCLHFLIGYLRGEAENHPERVYAVGDIVKLLNTVAYGRE